MKQTHISLAKIIVEDEIVARVELDDKYLFEIEQDIKDGAKLPPITLFYDGTKHYLVDGLHRFQAAKNLKQEMIVADIREGNQRNAILFSCSANSEHGLRRTNNDKRKAVNKMLADPEWSQWSDGLIAKQCVVTQPFVSRVRRNLTQNSFESSSNRKGKDGRTYNTEKIGGSRRSGETGFSEDTNANENDAGDTFMELSKVPLSVDDLNPKKDVDSMEDETSQIGSNDSGSRHDNDNDLNTDSDEQQDKPIPSSKQIAKFADQIAAVTSKLSKIKAILENQSSKPGNKMKRLRKLKEDLEKAWIKLNFEFDSLIRN